MRFEEVIGRLEGLPDPLPGPADVLLPVVLDGPIERGWPVPSPDRAARAAAVLVLLYPEDGGQTRVVLIERTTGDGHHSGEVSFPGGTIEPGDRDAAAAALREAHEEVGLDASAAGVHVVGLLERFWIPVSNFQVTPVLALADGPPSLIASKAEVTRIVEPPLATFLPDAPIEMIERTLRGRTVRYGAYAVDGLSVWGATARILSQLGRVLAPLAAAGR